MDGKEGQIRRVLGHHMCCSQHGYKVRASTLQESVTHMAGALGSTGTPHCPKSLAPQANTSWPSQMIMVWR
jgi:hypothetical protein